MKKQKSKIRLIFLITGFFSFSLIVGSASAATTKNFGIVLQGYSGGAPCFYLGDVSYLESEGLLKLSFVPWLENVKNTPARTSIRSENDWRVEALCKGKLFRCYLVYQH